PCTGEPVERVPSGKLADWVLERARSMSAAEIAEFRRSNKEQLNEFWAKNKTDANKLKAELEKLAETASKQASPPFAPGSVALNPERLLAAAQGATPAAELTSGGGVAALLKVPQLLAQLKECQSLAETIAWENARTADIEAETEPNRHVIKGALAKIRAKFEE